MDFKEIPVGPRQDNTKILSEIEANLEKSLAGWEPLLNVVYDALLEDDLKLVRAIQIPIEKALKMIKQGDKEIPVGSRQEAEHKCDTSTLLEVCSVCCSLVCQECVDWESMRKTNTWQIVCKECSKLFENCKGDN